MNPLLLVNFGGPRNPQEILSFLEELLTDQDVVRTNLPQFFHNLIFKNVARKRTKKIRHDYDFIGGKSPIYEDTETLAKLLSEKLDTEVICFHRYLKSTHKATLEKLNSLPLQPITVLPLFPQFSYATTGSIARFFAKNLCGKTLHSLRWIRSYAKHPSYIACFKDHIKNFLRQNGLEEDKTLLLFSAHGVPQSFICTGDLYQDECELSYQLISQSFQASSLLCYQSKFGPGAWLKPYTIEVTENITKYTDKENIVVVPLSFTSDHIETLYEIEAQYLPPIRHAGKNAYRCPAFQNQDTWLSALHAIIKESELVNNQMLIRRNYNRCCSTCCPKKECLCLQEKD